MKLLDRKGIFMARPLSFGLKDTQDSQSLALVIEFLITGKLNEEENHWEDWTQYDEHGITGYFYIIKRDGTVNTITVDNLVKAIDWDGNLANINIGPAVESCQINVVWNEYKGKERLQVAWINPHDFVPGPTTMDGQDLEMVQKRHGSLLRAAVAASKKGQPKSKPKSKPEPEKPVKVDEKDLPF